ncbi:hypothetical protein SKAU_G00073930 [Synaphobranchus kaupii]|uniref:Uncharacterized protein n=1 Tax=Synaphobranchus kaupii TaxID=118154 RepID=A0A9Q1G857_SYNKA|nr:hypothetical protein SKAU_G00073930 [Synaphobranchus kaupii]
MATLAVLPAPWLVVTDPGDGMLCLCVSLPAVQRVGGPSVGRPLGREPPAHPPRRTPPDAGRPMDAVKVTGHAQASAPSLALPFVCLLVALHWRLH